MTWACFDSSTKKQICGVYLILSFPLVIGIVFTLGSPLCERGVGINFVDDCRTSNTTFCIVSNCNQCLYNNPVRCKEPPSLKVGGFIVLSISLGVILLVSIYILVQLYLYNKRNRPEIEPILIEVSQS